MQKINSLERVLVAFFQMEISQQIFVGFFLLITIIIIFISAYFTLKKLIDHGVKKIETKIELKMKELFENCKKENSEKCDYGKSENIVFRMNIEKTAEHILKVVSENKDLDVKIQFILEETLKAIQELRKLLL